MANTSIVSAFERFWQHVVAKIGEKADANHTHDIYETKENATNKLTEAKQYTDTEVAALVNSAPETLDTIGELAAAFEENQDMVQTIDEAITLKANLSDLQATQEDISSLQSQVLSDSLILTDAITGSSYTIQIQNGQLVSFPVE